MNTKVNTTKLTSDNFHDYVRTLSGPGLVELYNEMVATAIDLGLSDFTTTKRFADRGVARGRLQKLHATIQARVQADTSLGTDVEADALIQEKTEAAQAADTAASAAQPGPVSGSTEEGADDMAKKAAAKKGKGAKRPKSTDGTSIREMTEQYNDIVKGMSAAQKKEFPWAKHHSSFFESKEKAKKQLARLKKAVG